MDRIRFAVRPAALVALASLPIHVLMIGYPAVLAASVVPGLRHAGIEVSVAATVAEAIPMVARLNPAILLLDLDDVGRHGMAQIEQLARFGGAGLIVVLAQDDPHGRVACLDHGADDALARQAPPIELAARIRALHRRIIRLASINSGTEDGVLAVDAAHRALIGLHGEQTPLSEAEFIALETLLDADGAPVSREWLGRVALKRPLHADDRSVDQLVLKLRRKLTAAGASDRTILSARRQGYMIADPSRLRTYPAGDPTEIADRDLVDAEGA